MEITINPNTVRTMVKRLRENLGLTQSAAYEAVAQTLGHPNWDTLSGMLKAELLAQDNSVFAQAAKRHHWRTAPPALKQPFMLVWEAFACDEYGEGPGWGQLEVTQEVLNELHEMQTLCLQNSCEISRDFGGMEWGNDDSLRLRGDELHVSASSFWVRARPKHCDYYVETRMMDIEELFKLIDQGQAAATPYLAWADGVLFKDGSSAKQFALQMLDEGVAAVNEGCIDEMPV